MNNCVFLLIFVLSFCGQSVIIIKVFWVAGELGDCIVAV